MANSYLKGAFAFCVTAAEADLLRAVLRALLMVDDIDNPSERGSAFASLGPQFAAIFPPLDDEPFSAFLDLFDGVGHFGCDIEIGEPDVNGRVEIYVGGEQLELEAIGELLFRCAKSALPIGFEYALDCDRLRPGEFGGGYVAITAKGVEIRGSSYALNRALARDLNEGADGYVLAVRDEEHGLSFWNNEAGFGRLYDATVFSEGECSHFDKPIADDEPEWLAMPAPLR